MNIQLPYNFYESYIGNQDFDNKLKERLSMVKRKYFLGSAVSDENVLKEYFVEVFSWTVFPVDVLHFVVSFIIENGLKGVIDPCCGNAFHTFLFGNICNLNTFTVDIQDEENSWREITECDGRDFMRGLTLVQHKDNALLLSWIDYESLTIELLQLYKGKMVISVGNYDRLSPRYIEILNKGYSMAHRFVLNMPWGLSEKIEIYTR